MAAPANDITIVKPLLKWVGGKTQILETVLQEFPSQIHHYYEPFVGGGSVLLGVLSYQQAGKLAISGRIYASDTNSNLIEFYKNVQQNPTELLTACNAIMDEFSTCLDGEVNRAPTTLEEAHSSRESYYFWIRRQFNALSYDDRKKPRAAAMFLFLNKTGFRGMYREGPHGFNVPYGNYKNVQIIDEAHLRVVSQLIQGVVFRVASFVDALELVQPGDTVYLDPPYVPEKNTSFVGYNADGFSVTQHQRLFTICHELAHRHCKWIMSNADVPLVRESFPYPYQTQVISCRRAIHSKKPGSKTNEVLITNVR
jgi:DNA adenine methylase